MIIMKARIRGGSRYKYKSVYLLITIDFLFFNILTATEH